MPNDLLESARQEAEKAEPSIRAAALLRIARAEYGTNMDRARTTLPEASELIRGLPLFAQGYLLRETREVTAAVSPQLLAEMPTIRRGSHERFESANLVRIMLAHGHVDAAFDYSSTSTTKPLFHAPQSETFFRNSIRTIRNAPRGA